MNYLADEGVNNRLIKAFVDSYQENKTITSGIKQDVLLHAPKDLDFTNEIHQTFYMFYHLINALEMEANERILGKK